MWTIGTVGTFDWVGCVRTGIVGFTNDNLVGFFDEDDAAFGNSTQAWIGVLTCRPNWFNSISTDDNVLGELWCDDDLLRGLSLTEPFFPFYII